MKHVPFQKALCVKREQLQHASIIHSTALGRCQECFIVAPRLQIIEVAQPPATIQHLLIKDARPAVLALIRKAGVGGAMQGSELEGLFETDALMSDVKLFI